MIFQLMRDRGLGPEVRLQMEQLVLWDVQEMLDEKPDTERALEGTSTMVDVSEEPSPTTTSDVLIRKDL